MTPERRNFVHLAYLDDSDTKSKTCKWQVMSGVVLEDRNFKLVERGMYNIQQKLVPVEKLDSFEEFHACELYGGYGVFADIDQGTRFEAITRLLQLIEIGDISVVYGAVDMNSLQKEVYASADPLDISFRICAKGIESWIAKHIVSQKPEVFQPNIAITEEMVTRWLEELVILIADDCDKKVRDSLQKSFRNLRPHPRQKRESAPLFHFHDDMYFGDSRYSLGIQLADLCSYFIARHLAGDAVIEGFYKMIEPHIVFSEVHPPPDVNLASIDSLAPPEHDEVASERLGNEEKTNGE